MPNIERAQVSRFATQKDVVARNAAVKQRLIFKHLREENTQLSIDNWFGMGNRNPETLIYQ